MPEHSTLTDPELHEPKGAATALAGQIYVADGAASGAWAAVSSTNTVVVNAKADFPAAVAGVITLLADTLYLIGADVSLGTDRLVLASNTAVSGIESLVVTLTYTGTGDMFTLVDTDNRVSMLTISCVNGRVFNWTTTVAHTFRANDLSITCNKLALFTAVNGSARFSNVSGTMAADGISFVGSFENFFYDTGNIVQPAGDLLRLGVATFDAFIAETIIINLSSGANLLSGAVSSGNINAGGIGSIERTRISGVGTPMISITEDDALWNFDGNDDIRDSRPDGLLYLPITTNLTPITTVSVPVKIAGTWAEERTSQFNWTTGGRLVYTGGKDAVLPILARVSVEPASGVNKEIGVFIALNGTAIANSISTAHTDSGAPTSVTCPWQLNFAPGDYIEVFLSNETDTTDVIGSTAVLRIN